MWLPNVAHSKTSRSVTRDGGDLGNARLQWEEMAEINRFSGKTEVFLKWELWPLKIELFSELHSLTYGQCYMQKLKVQSNWRILTDNGDYILQVWSAGHWDTGFTATCLCSVSFSIEFRSDFKVLNIFRAFHNVGLTVSVFRKVEN